MKKNRLFQMLCYLLEHGKVTANELAQEFGVSVRTIYRDVDSLSGAGIPIYASQGKGGGIEIAKDFVLNEGLFHTGEKDEMLVVLQGLESTSPVYEKELLGKLSALFNRKQSQWIEVTFSPWQVKKGYDPLFETIKYAILNKEILDFAYFSAYEKKSHRQVKPIRLVFKEEDWYLYGFCLLRQECRYFKLSRMQDLVLTGESFDDDVTAFPFQKEAKGNKEVNLSLKCHRRLAFRVYDEFRGYIKEEDSNYLYVEISMPDNEALYHYLFSFGDALEVLAPQEVRLGIQDHIQGMLDIYQR